MLEAVLFDLDGTLTHSDPLHFGVFATMLAEQGIPIDDAFYRQHISGRTNRAIFQDLFPAMDDADIAALSDAKEAHFRQVARHQLRPMAGLMALLHHLAQRQCPAAVVTNAPRPNAEFMLEVLGLGDRFEFVILGEELPRAKPDPLPYQVALTNLGISPDAAVVFEDSPSGICAAVAAQIPTIGVASSHPPARLKDCGARWVIADFTDPQLEALGLLPGEG